MLQHLAQLVEHLTLGFSSGHDLTVREFEPHVGLCVESVEPAWDSFSPPLSAPHSVSVSLSLSLSLSLSKVSKLKKKKRCLSM